MSRPFAEGNPFNFLGLPKEVRLMVYERIPIITHHTITSPSLNSFFPEGFSLVTTTAPVAILATCRRICKEADAILQTRARRIKTLTMPEGRLPRFIFQTHNLVNLTTFLSILDENTEKLRFYQPCYNPTSPTLWKDPAIEKVLCKIPALQTRKEGYRQLMPNVCSQEYCLLSGGFVFYWWSGCPTRYLRDEIWKADIESAGCHVDFSCRRIKVQVYGPSKQVGYIEKLAACPDCQWNITIEYICETQWTKEWAEGEQL